MQKGLTMTKQQLREKFNLWLGNQFDAQLKASKGQTRRWVFCYNLQDKEDCFDCACCLSDEEHRLCGCICHTRITQIVDFFWKELNKKRKK